MGSKQGLGCTLPPPARGIAQKSDQHWKRITHIDRTDEKAYLKLQNQQWKYLLC
jgi:hypothetical protein